MQMQDHSSQNHISESSDTKLPQHLVVSEMSTKGTLNRERSKSARIDGRGNGWGFQWGFGKETTEEWGEITSAICRKQYIKWRFERETQDEERFPLGLDGKTWSRVRERQTDRTEGRTFETVERRRERGAAAARVKKY